MVDGQENPIVTIAAMKFFEVQKYLTLSNHGFIAYVFMLNKPFLDKLPADQRELLNAGSAGNETLFQRAILGKKVEEDNLAHVQESRHRDHHAHAGAARGVREGGDAGV